MLARPIFIVGAARSGTTLLRVMLDSHSNIAAGPEFRILLNFARISEFYIPVYKGYGFGRHDWFERVREFHGGFLSDYATGRGKGRWCDKTPAYGFHLDFIRELYPDAQIIHIIRDGRAVVRSHLQRWGSRRAIRAMGEWRDLIEKCRKFGHRWPEQYHELRYEDLVRDPEAELRRLLEFLGEPWEAAVLEPYATTHDAVKGNFHGKRPEEPHSARAARECSKGVHTQSLAAGNSLNPLLKWLLLRRAGGLMRELDYI